MYKIVKFILQVGDDVWGPKYIANLKTENVNTEFVKITKNSSSGIAQINVANDGTNQIVIVAGANSKLDINDIEEAELIISAAEVLIMQLETPIETAIRAMQLAKNVCFTNLVICHLLTKIGISRFLF